MYDKQHHEIRHKDIQQNDIQYNDTQQKGLFLLLSKNNIQRKWLSAQLHSIEGAVMLSVAMIVMMKLCIIMANVAMLSVIMLNVVAP